MIQQKSQKVGVGYAHLNLLRINYSMEKPKSAISSLTSCWILGKIATFVYEA